MVTWCRKHVLNIVYDAVRVVSLCEAAAYLVIFQSVKMRHLKKVVKSL